ASPRSVAAPWPWPRWCGYGRARIATPPCSRTGPYGATRRGRASVRCGDASLGPPHGKAMGSQRLLDLFDRLLAEVGDRGQLGLGLCHQIADRLDADALEAVVAAHAQLELLDQDVLHAVRARRGNLGPTALGT